MIDYGKREILAKDVRMVEIVFLLMEITPTTIRIHPHLVLRSNRGNFNPALKKRREHPKPTLI